MDKLSQARAVIDEVDAQMAQLFCRRMDAVRDVVAYKKEHGLPVLDASREEAVVEKNLALLPDKAYAEWYEDFVRHNMAVSRAFQSRVLARDAVAYQGVEGAFSHIALTRLFPHAAARAYPTWAQVFDAVEKGEAACGVLPFENSHAGDVSEVLDLCFAHEDLCVQQVYDLPVSQNLLGVPGAKEEEIAVVYSHEQALTQCAQFLDAHASWRRIPYYNTAASAKMVADAGDRTQAALTSRLAAKYYGLEILREGVNTRTDNFTRFIIVSAQPEPVEAPDKATITFTLRHERGTLHRALACFVALGMNMMRIESRPNEVSWEYRFYVDLSGNVSPKYMDVLLESLRADCIDCRLLGVYRANGGQTHA